jgi:hypothetical protein
VEPIGRSPATHFAWSASSLSSGFTTAVGEVPSRGIEDLAPRPVPASLGNAREVLPAYSWIKVGKGQSLRTGAQANRLVWQKKPHRIDEIPQAAD